MKNTRQNNVIISIYVLVFIILYLFTGSAFAIQQLIPRITNGVGLTDMKQGGLLIRTGQHGVYRIAPVVDTHVEMKINGLVVRTTVTQAFTNPDNEWVEGVYVFPLPTNAAVDHMRMKIGARIVEGEIKEREQAKKIYNKAKREGKKAALIDQERPNLFTNSVANIGPNETVSIEIQYQQTVKYEQILGEGKFELRFPLTMTPRYIPGTPVPDTLINKAIRKQRDYQPLQVAYHKERIESFTQTGWALDTDIVPDASRITPPVFLPSYTEENETNPVSIKVVLNAGFPINRITSPYHNIQATHIGQGKAEIQLVEGKVPTDRDFNLSWTIDSGYSPKAALFTEEVDGDMYNLIMVMPPTDGIEGTQPLAKEVVYIIDTSGSMGGTSIEQAKAALRMALQRLRSIDKFNIIQFNSITTTLFAHPRPANSENLYHANRYVDGLYSTGGTEMYPAISSALNQAHDEQMVRQIIFLTDGSVGNETQLFGLIEKNLGNSRLFTVGIGSAPNSFFMSRAAEFGRGTYTYIGDTSEVQTKMQELFTRLETPVLTDLKVSLPEGVNMEIWPQRIPDLYLGEPVVIVAKTSDFTGNIQINGQRSQTIWEVDLPMLGGQQGNGVAPLWARAKIKALMDSLMTGAAKEQVKQEVVKVALQHHLVSKYTSLVAVDKTPARPENLPVNKKAVPNNLPHGSTLGNATGQTRVMFARSATDGQIKLIIGLLFISLALLVTWRTHWCRQ